MIKGALNYIPVAFLGTPATCPTFVSMRPGNTCDNHPVPWDIQEQSMNHISPNKGRSRYSAKSSTVH